MFPYGNGASDCGGGDGGIMRWELWTSGWELGRLRMMGRSCCVLH